MAKKLRGRVRGDGCTRGGRYRLPPDNYRRPDEELLADLRRVARLRRTRVLTTTMYRLHGRFDQSTIISRFGGWSVAMRRVGLRARWHRYTMSELMMNIGAVWNARGRPPVRDDLCRPPSRISRTPYLHRFGRFREALAAFVRWVDSPEGRRMFTTRHSMTPARQRGTRISGCETPSRRCRVRRVPVSRRYTVLKRDRFRCRACGRSPASHPGVELQVDHIRPIARGGSDSLGNLQTLCKQCNYGKGARDAGDARTTARTLRR
jgi:5-methylcytosine-specific restriction endonuclease McrA